VGVSFCLNPSQTGNTIPMTAAAFQPLVDYLTDNKIKALLYDGHVGITGAKMAIDREHIAVKITENAVSTIYGCILDTEECFVNRQPATQEDVATFNAWVGKIQEWGDADRVEIRVIAEVDQ